MLIDNVDEEIPFTHKILPYYDQMINVIQDYYFPIEDEKPSNKEIQTDSQIDIKTIKDIIYNYPELKNTAIGILLSDLIKRGNITKTEIDEIKRFDPQFPKSFINQKHDEINKPQKLKNEDYENMIPKTFDIVVHFKNSP